MGAAQSTNTASAVANVCNYISQNVSVSDSQINTIYNQIKLKNCYIGGNLDINTVATIMAKSNQIATVVQNANVQNNIAQKVLQQAISEIGSMGIGYSSANNNVSVFANASSSISNSVSLVANKFSFNSNTFTCDSSHIGGNVNIDFSNSTTFLSDQTLKVDAIQNIQNTIDQSVSQTASAKVAGLVGFLLALALVIVAAGYTFAKIEAPLSGIIKIIIITALLVGIPAIVLVLYLYNAPPFFNKPIDCSLSSTIGNPSDCIDCIDVSQRRSYISNPPLRYNFPINSTGSTPGLLQLVIAKQSDINPANGGYNGDAYLSFASESGLEWKEDTSYQSLGLPQLPNPLKMLVNSDGTFCTIDSDHQGKLPNGLQTTCSVKTLIIQGSIAVLNSTAWNSYCATSPKHALHARFVLCKFLGIPTNVYIQPDEEVFYIDNNNQPSSDRSKCYLYNGFTAPGSYADAIIGQGYLNGLFGYCNNNSYKLHKFMVKYGVWILLAIFLLITVVVIYLLFIRKKTYQKLNFID